jgi:hypothetical protein
METVLGFVVGYWIGTRHGRQGMQQALDSARDIWASPETRRLVAEGVSALEAAAPVLTRLGRESGSRKATLIGGVMDDLIKRRTANAT